MKKPKFVILNENDENDYSKETEALYFDGYHIGDRLLEGVVIKASINPNTNDLIIEADWPLGIDKDYFIQLAEDHVLDYDVFSSDETLSDDNVIVVFDF